MHTHTLSQYKHCHEKKEIVNEWRKKRRKPATSRRWSKPINVDNSMSKHEPAFDVKCRGVEGGGGLSVNLDNEKQGEENSSYQRGQIHGKDGARRCSESTYEHESGPRGLVQNNLWDSDKSLDPTKQIIMNQGSRTTTWGEHGLERFSTSVAGTRQDNNESRDDDDAVRLGDVVVEGCRRAHNERVDQSAGVDNANNNNKPLTILTSPATTKADDGEPVMSSPDDDTGIYSMSASVIQQQQQKPITSHQRKQKGGSLESMGLINRPQGAARDAQLGTNGGGGNCDKSDHNQSTSTNDHQNDEIPRGGEEESGGGSSSPSASSCSVSVSSTRTSNMMSLASFSMNSDGSASGVPGDRKSVV